MRGPRIAPVVATVLWLVGLAGAQAPERAGETAGTAATEDTTKVKLALTLSQEGRATNTLLKDHEAEVIVSLRVNMPAVRRANAQVVLDIGEQLNIESEEDAVIKALYIDNGTGFALQPTTTSRPRLGFQAPEGQTGVSGTQKVKWIILFKNIAAKAPFNATAAVMVPPDPQIVGRASDQVIFNVFSSLTVQQLWRDGGIFMWPLGFAFVIGIAFALERLWTLTFAKINAVTFFERIAGAVKERGPDKAVEVCDKTRGPVAAVIREGLLRVHQGIDHVEKAIESAGAVEGSFLQRGLVVLASVTTVAPLIGFLGTVWGMVIAFKAIAEAGDVRPSIVANGISQALITTVTGLIIAIIAQSMLNFIISRINRIIIDMEETSTRLVDLLIEQGLDKASNERSGVAA